MTIARDLPIETGEFWTPEVREALNAILRPHVAKKRATVLLLAFAEATQNSKTDVFEDPRACNQRVWYQKWQHEPEVAHALEICTARALAWRDEQTLRIEATALQERRRAIAEGSLDAITGLRTIALNSADRADYRTEASRVLLTLADEVLATRLAAMESRALPVEITEQPEQVVKLDVSAFPPEILRALANESATGRVMASGSEGVGEPESS